jgi:adenylate cyclase
VAGDDHETEAMLIIKVTNDKQNQQTEHSAGPLELGRGPQRDIKRIMIEDGGVSRDQLRMEELPNGRLRIDNLSLKIPVMLENGAEVPMGGNREVPLPIALTMGNTWVEIRVPSGKSTAVPVLSTKGQSGDGVQSTPKPASAAPLKVAQQASAQPELAIPPAPASRPAPVFIDPLAATEYTVPSGLATITQPVVGATRGRSVQQLQFGGIKETDTPERFAQWLETVLALQRSAGTAEEIYKQTAQSLVMMVNLDVGLVLMRRGDKWQVMARAAKDDARDAVGREFSTTILRHVVTEKRTFYQDLTSLGAQESLRNVDAVVVSPVFGLDEDEVVGVVYGSRRASPARKNSGIRPLDAQLVQLLAAAVGTTLARAEATKSRAQLEQFVTPEVAHEIERDKSLLEGRSLDVTILISDIRGFSRLAEQLGPENVCRLVRDVMERLSNRVVEHGGTIVNYLGDGLLAMWNAPTPRADHALLACQAALAMQREIPGINETWKSSLPCPLTIGIGVNTGPAQVGNTGSTRRLMYGPLGHTVNLASRMEGATKQFGVPILITGFTKKLIGDALSTRRLCQVRVVGIGGAVELYELHGENASPEWKSFRDAYETGLNLFETQQWSKAGQTLLPLLEFGDKPTLRLMNRALKCLEEPPDPFDPVEDLLRK